MFLNFQVNICKNFIVKMKKKKRKKKEVISPKKKCCKNGFLTIKHLQTVLQNSIAICWGLFYVHKFHSNKQNSDTSIPKYNIYCLIVHCCTNIEHFRRIYNARENYSYS